MFVVISESSLPHGKDENSSSYLLAGITLNVPDADGNWAELDENAASETAHSLVHTLGYVERTDTSKCC